MRELWDVTCHMGAYTMMAKAMWGLYHDGHSNVGAYTMMATAMWGPIQ